MSHLPCVVNDVVGLGNDGVGVGNDGIVVGNDDPQVGNVILATPVTA